MDAYSSSPSPQEMWDLQYSSPSPFSSANTNGATFGYPSNSDENFNPAHLLGPGPEMVARLPAPVHMGKPSSQFRTQVLSSATDAMLNRAGNPAYLHLARRNAELEAEIKTQRQRLGMVTSSGIDQINSANVFPVRDMSSYAFAELDRKDYPLVTIWAEDDWKCHPQNPRNRNNRSSITQKGKVTNDDGVELRETLFYIQDKDGNSVTESRADTITTAVRRTFKDLFGELRRLGRAPESWKKIPLGAIQQYRKDVYGQFPELRFCNEHWKSERLGIDLYPGWMRPKKGEQVPVKGETSVVVDDKKRERGSASPSERPDKRPRSEGIPSSLPSSNHASTGIVPSNSEHPGNHGTDVTALAKTLDGDQAASATSPSANVGTASGVKKPLLINPLLQLPRIASVLTQVDASAPQQVRDMSIGGRGGEIFNQGQGDTDSARPTEAETPDAMADPVTDNIQATGGDTTAAALPTPTLDPGPAATTPPQSPALAHAAAPAQSAQSLPFEVTPAAPATQNAEPAPAAMSPTQSPLAAQGAPSADPGEPSPPAAVFALPESAPAAPGTPTTQGIPLIRVPPRKGDIFRYQAGSCAPWNLFGEQYLKEHPGEIPTKQEIRSMYDALPENEHAAWVQLREARLNQKKSGGAK